MVQNKENIMRNEDINAGKAQVNVLINPDSRIVFDDYIMKVEEP